MAAERRPRILVVEDDEKLRNLLVTHFTAQEGYRVVAVANGPAALQCCRDGETLPHLVLLDITLSYTKGAMDGYEEKSIMVGYNQCAYALVRRSHHA